MAYYNYKHVRDIIPTEWMNAYIEKWDKENPHEPFDWGCDYDGMLWRAAADYIDVLHKKLTPPADKEGNE